MLRCVHSETERPHMLLLPSPQLLGSRSKHSCFIFGATADRRNPILGWYECEPVPKTDGSDVLNTHCREMDKDELRDRLASDDDDDDIDYDTPEDHWQRLLAEIYGGLTRVVVRTFAQTTS